MRVRDDIFERKEEILSYINANVPKGQIAAILHCNVKTLTSYLYKMNIDYKGNQAWGIYQKNKDRYISFKEYISHGGSNTTRIRQKLLYEGLKEHRCECCGQTFWQGHPIPLELHHKDGDHGNNDLSNLELLCPNCHAFTDNYRGRGMAAVKCKNDRITISVPVCSSNMKNKNCHKQCPVCGTNISMNANHCRNCAQKIRNLNHPQQTARPSYEMLYDDLIHMNMVTIGRKYRVSDNAVRKWCRFYNLPFTKKEILKLRLEFEDMHP